MAARSWRHGNQRHFVIRCWLESPAGGGAFWRGRVEEVNGASVAFQDAQRLLDFLLDCLRRPDGIELPLHGPPGGAA